MAYTATALKGQLFWSSHQAKYIARLQEKRRIDRRHSDFWLGLYGCLWINAWEFCAEFVKIMMMNNTHKLNNYQRGLTAMSLIEGVA
ncbi:MAG TPA: hypothetical protein DCF68_04035 [Cyanothece sp. UBA12306]|nr:hypothetical protein [Cyanothece sp. UBA12306]